MKIKITKKKSPIPVNNYALKKKKSTSQNVQGAIFHGGFIIPEIKNNVTLVWQGNFTEPENRLNLLYFILFLFLQ